MKKIIFIVLAVLLIFAVSCSEPGNGGADTTKAPDVTTEAPDVTTGTPDATTGTPDVTTGTPDVTTTTPDVTTDAPEATTEAPATSDGIAVGSDTDERPWGDPHFPV